jgi:acyl-CoA reductase-like NAD-dependent aldehyde dehydrogenase
MSITIPQLSAKAPTPNAELDRAVARLNAEKDGWARLRIKDKAALLHDLARRTGEVASRWVEAALRAKGLPADSSLAGEEWTSGPWALMYGAKHYATSLEEIADQGTPRLKPGAVRTRPDGQVIVDVFPQGVYDALLLNGITAEVWMEPGVTPANLPQNMAAFYRQRNPKGRVALVLGAGNIASIAPLDVLHKLYAEGQVSLLKMNPVNEYLGAFFEEVFAAYIEAGYVALAYGGVEVGEYLTQHPGIEELHITGSERTHDAIVFGLGPEGEARKRRGEPRNPRRITSELGNVSPVIVVPGPWTDADVRYQAEHIATMKMHNGGFNCVAGQVLVLPDAWEPAERLLNEIGRVLAEIPNRAAYYPGAAERHQAAVAAHPSALVIDAPRAGTTPRTIVRNVPASDAQNVSFCKEAFGSVLSATRVPGASAEEFLRNAVAFANATLWGTLGCNLLVHPATMRELGPALEDAIAALRYGCVAVNAWTGVGFLISQMSWGAFPGHTLADIKSGIGSVHNSLFFDRPQKSVVRQSFYPMPRGLLHGELSILPKPPWFVTNKTGAETCRRFVELEAHPSPLKLPAIFLSALRG